MVNAIMERYEYLRGQALEDAFAMPEKFKQEYLQRYRQAMTDKARESIRCLQEGLTYLTSLREKYPADLVLGELIWENIRLTMECIHGEQTTLARYRRDYASTTE